MLRRVAIALAVSLGIPSLGTLAAQETVTCKDGSIGKAGRGACAHHGGVAKDAAVEPASPPVSPAPATPPVSRAPANDRAPSRAAVAGQPTARCKDGTMSYSRQHSGSCSHHGGVARWLL
jgi:hypothetical protein